MQAENHVLLVEHDPPMRRSLESFLERAGYAFDSCATARDALGLVEDHRYAVVIAEYHLPDANGTMLLQKLMQVSPELGTILLSEYDHQVIADDLARAKVGTFLKKPFDLVELEAALSSAQSRVGASLGSPPVGSRASLQR